jgi:hypothetical protein
VSVPGSSADDEFVLVIVVAFALTAALGSAGLLWLQGVDWLVDHRVLLPATRHPLLVLRGCAGAGLDGRRLLVVTGAMLAGITWAASALRRGWVARGAER